MRAVAHSKEFAAKVGIPQSVGKEFNAADKRRAVIKRAVTTSKMLATRSKNRG
jgi:hypothetical protein